MAATARSVRWFALLLLLFNVVAGGVLPGTANARGNSYPDLDAAMVVCTAAGMVVLDHDSPSADGSGDPAYVCALCLPLIHGGAVLSAPMAVPALPVPVPLVLARPDSQRPADQAPLTGSLAPRAPPILA